jgi:hypothetical protein
LKSSAGEIGGVRNSQIEHPPSHPGATLFYNTQWPMARQKNIRWGGIHLGPGTTMAEIRTPLKNILDIISNSWVKIKDFTWFFLGRKFSLIFGLHFQ